MRSVLDILRDPQGVYAKVKAKASGKRFVWLYHIDTLYGPEDVTELYDYKEDDCTYTQYINLRAGISMAGIFATPTVRVQGQFSVMQNGDRYTTGFRTYTYGASTLLNDAYTVPGIDDLRNYVNTMDMATAIIYNNHSAGHTGLVGHVPLYRLRYNWNIGGYDTPMLTDTAMETVFRIDPSIRKAGADLINPLIACLVYKQLAGREDIDMTYAQAVKLYSTWRKDMLDCIYLRK